MQIVSLVLDHHTFYSPSTGGVILDETDMNESEPSLLGYWLDEFWEEPLIKDQFLEEKWQEYLSNFDKSSAQGFFTNPFDSLENFFNSLKIDNVVVFKITDKMPLSPTAYLVIDLNVS